MKNIFLIFCICIVIFSCEKEEVNPLIDYTYNYTEPVDNPFGSLNMNCAPGQIVYEQQDFIYSNAIFNPINPNEIAYLRKPFSENGCKYQLWTFNLKTGNSRKVTSKKICRFDWSILNWIIFTDQNFSIWKVKPNGDELKKVSPNVVSTNIIKCHPHKPQILTEAPSLISFGNAKKIIDFEGQTIKPLGPLEFEYFDDVDWKDDQLLFQNNFGFKIYNFNTEELTEVELNTHSLNNFHFFGDNEVIYTTEKSIYKYNLKTGEKSLIKGNGDNDWFEKIDISLDKKTMLVQKQDFYKKDECTIQVRRYLAFLNIGGTDERKILLPE